jgi:hypothetical protein
MASEAARAGSRTSIGLMSGCQVEARMQQAQSMQRRRLCYYSGTQIANMLPSDQA